MMDYKQVCKKCGSDQVARCKWVNVNDDTIYDADSGTFLEWCFGECQEETTIVDEDEYIDEEQQDEYEEFLESVYEEVMALARTKHAGWGGWNAIMMALNEVEDRSVSILSLIDFSHVDKGKAHEKIFHY